FMKLTIELRNLAKDILDNKWTAYKKPFFSSYFKDALQLPKEMHEPIEVKIDSTFKELTNLINTKFAELQEKPE
ncbi:22912_t:CDS:1, partial [Gigaspora rosea]